MKLETLTRIPGKPYPVAAGKEYGYRCFKDGRWHDCDSRGKIIERGRGK